MLVDYFRAFGAFLSRSDPALPKEQSAVTPVGSTSDLKECSGVPASLSHYSLDAKVDCLSWRLVIGVY